MPTEAQKVDPLIIPSQRIRVVPDGALVDLAFGVWRRADGFSQLRGIILSSKPGSFIVLGNVQPGTGTDVILENSVLAAGVPYQFVVDITVQYIRVMYSDVPSGAPANIEACAYLLPISDLESNRSAASGDNVWTLLGANGAVGRGSLVGGAAAVIVIPANANRRSATLRNIHTAAIFWGYTPAEATAANGFPLNPQDSYTWKETTKEIYAFFPGPGNAPWASDQQLKV